MKGEWIKTASEARKMKRRWIKILRPKKKKKATKVADTTCKKLVKAGNTQVKAGNTFENI